MINKIKSLPVKKQMAAVSAVQNGVIDR